jgi:hypothetical protein
MTNRGEIKKKKKQQENDGKKGHNEGSAYWQTSSPKGRSATLAMGRQHGTGHNTAKTQARKCLLFNVDVGFCRTKDEG